MLKHRKRQRWPLLFYVCYWHMRTERWGLAALLTVTVVWGTTFLR